MKILNAEQIRAADAYTIKNEPISSLDLMERAATRCFEWLMDNFKYAKFHVIAGMGNNGGDGLVIARLLHEQGISCRTTILKLSERGSPDFEKNRERLIQSKGDVSEHNITESLRLGKDEIVVDCIFGSGLTRSVEGKLAERFSELNQKAHRIVSIDIPSGLYMSDNSLNKGKVVKADVTLSFEVPKLSFLLPNRGNNVGEWFLLDIGLDKEFLNNQNSHYSLVTSDWVSSVLPVRPRFSHKGSFGHALLLAGEYGKMGAAILSSRACLKSGVGLLTSYIPRCGYQVMQTAVPEAMCLCSENEENLRGLPNLDSYSAIGFGPGVGTREETAQVLKLLIQESKVPLVIDADGLNILSENKTWLSFIPQGSVLTPHPGEFRRLFGDFKSDEARLAGLKELAQKHQIVIVLKGAHTAVAWPNGKVYFNSTGNPGMATAGSGDALTGVILSFLAQGFQPELAASLAVFYHGLAGDLAAQEMSEMGITAGDIVEALPYALP